MNYSSNVTEQCPVLEDFNNGEIEQSEVAEMQSVCTCHICEIKRIKAEEMAQNK